MGVLICTDLAARGLDLPVTRHVIQAEMAQNTIGYIHRVGRAARAGRASKATHLWGDRDHNIRLAILKCTDMGLDGEIVSRERMRFKMRRIRKNMCKQQGAWAKIREHG